MNGFAKQVVFLGCRSIRVMAEGSYYNDYGKNNNRLGTKLNFSTL